ncbi:MULTISPECIES: carboxylate-amine ligase [Kitasatospora]|uniref:Putative glutamate--cysteine ligase 2 n=1 Tax=Kitasatospora cystarginea TaxID=58350 RepID=A0ABN3EQ90_9ACTN
MAAHAPPELLSLGVEEEFLLVDRRSRRPVPRAPEVIAEAGLTLGGRVQAEFYPTQIEVCTSPVRTVDELRAELVFLRRTVAAVARSAGCLLVASGTPALPGHIPAEVTDNPRYRRMAEQFGAVADGNGGGVCGCHVHLGTASRAQALALANQLRPWLPTVQALAVNSPFNEGRDSGFASWRAILWNRWPTVGPAPILDEAGYEELANTLVDSGLLLDRRMIYWYARPSEHVPTLELRVADVNADLDTAVLLALLLRGLATVLLAEVREGVPAPDVSGALLRAAHFQAARGGLDGAGVDPFTGRARPLRTLLEDLMLRAAPGLRDSGDLPLVEQLLAGLLASGTGANRQRAAFRRRGRLLDVVDALAELTVP